MGMWSEKSDKSCHETEMNVSEQRRRPRSRGSPKHNFFGFGFIVLIDGLRKIVLRSRIVVVVVIVVSAQMAWVMVFRETPDRLQSLPGRVPPPSVEESTMPTQHLAFGLAE